MFKRMTRFVLLAIVCTGLAFSQTCLWQEGQSETALWSTFRFSAHLSDTIECQPDHVSRPKAL